MTTPTTIHDLPDDMLYEVFQYVFVEKPHKKRRETSWPVVYLGQPPEGAHLALRCVCRRWRGIADWVRLTTANVCVNTWELADAGAIRLRQQAAFKRLALAWPPGVHSLNVSRAAVSLINGSADLRRALQFLQLESCCLPSIAPAVPSVASCTSLTRLALACGSHQKERVVPSSVLAPLSALRMLEVLSLGQPTHGTLPKSALLAPLPALPDAPRLTSLALSMSGNFVPVGSDAALGRLGSLALWHLAPVQELVDAEDPFLLRAAFDAGTWQPSRLTGLRELAFTFGPIRSLRAPVRPPRTRSRPGAEFAPLAGQITHLALSAKSIGYKRPSTGMVAGLGVLTALRDLSVEGDFIRTRPDLLELASFDRVCAPHLTVLQSDSVSEPVNLARFQDLVYLSLVSISRPPLVLRSLVARSSLQTLMLGANGVKPLINLAELFVGGAGWPVLEALVLQNMVLEWDETGLDGAPTAAEFEKRARQLLPVLRGVMIVEPSGRDALLDRSRIAFVLASRRHVVPVLRGFYTGPKIG